MSGIITLTTDFGLSDGYVAAMKGVIFGISPEVKLVDVCHSIKPQNIAQAAFVLSTAYPYFPQKTIHLVVVDPGVGSERRAIILRTPTADFVAPDNGVLSYVIRRFSNLSLADDSRIELVELGPELEAVSLTEPRFWRTPVSPTFHGRDIFAPVAALLSLGFPPINFGEAVSSVMMLPLQEPSRGMDGSLVGNVLNIDNFGNLITNFRSGDLPPVGQPVTITVSGQVITDLTSTYSEGKGLLALIGSSGYLEVSLKGGNAHAFTGAEVGTEVRIRKPRARETTR
ncbi:S-adenosyl-l-methionine hydroxide adenosyltransferase family protein [Chloroflexota bacterium]